MTETVSDYLVQSLPTTLTVKNGDTGTALMNLIPIGGFAQVVNIAAQIFRRPSVASSLLQHSRWMGPTLVQRHW